MIVTRLTAPVCQKKTPEALMLIESVGYITQNDFRNSRLCCRINFILAI